MKDPNAYKGQCRICRRYIRLLVSGDIARHYSPEGLKISRGGWHSGIVHCLGGNTPPARIQKGPGA